jgi:His/Glu/Gln/Arg/opine family amino acid ABC transporter permease subunit
LFDLGGFGAALVAGTWVTLKISFAGLVYGLLFGLIGAVSKLSRFSAIRYFADILITIIRGIPELVLVLAVYFGGSVIINDIAAKLGYTHYIEINKFVAGVLAVGTTFGAYATEVFRGAILAVPKGQIEAARVFGMGGFLIFRRIVLPQVWRVALPGLGNLFLVLQKNTALVSVIGLHDLMRNASAAAQFTKQPFTFYMAASFIYLAVTTITMLGTQYSEQRARRGVRGV